jgi:hypothetical protein
MEWLPNQHPSVHQEGKVIKTHDGRNGQTAQALIFMCTMHGGMYATSNHTDNSRTPEEPFVLSTSHVGGVPFILG